MQSKRLMLPLAALLLTALPAAGERLPDWETYLRNSAVDRATLDVFLDDTKRSWAQFDPVVGYRVGNYMPHDGLDGSSTISTAQANGARTQHTYADRPCRINTYGNSFTLCHQVSDAETWQEYLAGHLGEPVRNFGMGGFGAYQSFRRMIRENSTDHDAEYVMFYIWGDDHLRSLLRCRHAAIYPWWDHEGGRMFHNNFWANIEMNLETGRLEEQENLLPTKASVYRMADPKFMLEYLRSDLALNMMVWLRGKTSELLIDDVRVLAGHLGMGHLVPGHEMPTRPAVQKILDRYGFAATKYILEMARSFTESRGKKMMVILFDPYKVLKALVNGEPRFDQEVVDYLESENYRYFDMNVVHAKDFKDYAVPFQDYMDRYFIGHYKPAGNHFFAYSIKNLVVDWLADKPITYRNQNDRWITFDGYLEK